MDAICNLCANIEFDIIHSGTRDVPNINVLKCKECGLVCLSSFKNNTETAYEKSQMRNNSYSSIADTYMDIEWDLYIKTTEDDDNRRIKALESMCENKRILEFGCGNGGFLRRIKDVADSITGIELSEECRNHLNDEGIRVVRDFDSLDSEKFDIIVMFMVIEHLNMPEEQLRAIYEHLETGGLLICETPNSDDALITLYDNEHFKKFTYWSEHVYLYNSSTLQKLIEHIGFQTIWNRQIQRYSLANHLYWLANGKPGGHKKWEMFNDKILNARYEEMLQQSKQCDTLFACFQK